MNKAPEYHTPVLGPEIAARLVGDPDGTYLDGTLGGGGHAALLLERMGGAGRLVGIDRDPEAIAAASARLRRFGARAVIVQAPFWRLKAVLADLDIAEVSGVLFDLGVSSHQIDDPARGFSYTLDGPLDMRMGPDTTRTAQEVINTSSQEMLTRIFREFGEERAAGRIARAILRRRARVPLTRTSELAEIVAGAVGGAHVQKSLARIFQAIRIEVNSELTHLRSTLEDAIDVLRPGGRLAVLSYHSLEDRTVKETFRDAARGCICPPDLPVCGCGRVASLKVLTARSIRAGKEEQALNPRARSASLRIAERLPEAS